MAIDIFAVLAGGVIVMVAVAEYLGAIAVDGFAPLLMAIGGLLIVFGVAVAREEIRLQIRRLIRLVVWAGLVVAGVGVLGAHPARSSLVMAILGIYLVFLDEGDDRRAVTFLGVMFVLLGVQGALTRPPTEMSPFNLCFGAALIVMGVASGRPDWRVFRRRIAWVVAPAALVTCVATSGFSRRVPVAAQTALVFAVKLLGSKDRGPATEDLGPRPEHR